MSGWYERAYETLERLSESSIWSEMLLEWEFNGNVLEVDNANCELCDHAGLMWHFEIVNKHNANKLFVGSECIKNFYGEYNQAHPELEQVDIDSLDSELKEIVREFIEANRKFNIRMVLRAIRIRNSRFPIKLKNGKFSPNQLKWILGLADEYNIDFDPSDFKLQLKKLRFFKQIGFSSESRLTDLIDYLKYVRPSLSISQINSLEKPSENRMKYMQRKGIRLFESLLK